MIAAETMEGINGNKAHGIPHDKVIEILRMYNRIDWKSDPTIRKNLHRSEPEIRKKKEGIVKFL